MVIPSNEGLRALAPLSIKLHADALADKIASLITPVHPNKPDVRLRLGLSKRGEVYYFEPVGTEWKIYESPKHTALRELGEYAHLLVFRRGTSGIHLYHYEPDG
jgi:hypothetical protein